MTGAASRLKGQRGEREFYKELGKRLEVVLYRNLHQNREGGSDTATHPILEPYYIEIRYRDSLSVQAWWREVKEKAAERGKVPVLVYRKPYQQFSVMSDLSDYVAAIDDSIPITMSVESFSKLIGYNSYEG